MQDLIAGRFREIAPAADFVSLMLIDERSERLSVRDDILLPLEKSLDLGAMITVVDGSGMGYCATSDLSLSGLRKAADKALDWAKLSAGRMVCDFSGHIRQHSKGFYESEVKEAWDDMPLSEKAAMLCRVTKKAAKSELIVNREAAIWFTLQDSMYLTMDGGELRSRLHLFCPEIIVAANRGADTQIRSTGSKACRQGGLELLEIAEMELSAETLADEAIELLDAENCPSGKMDLLVEPDQMLLQIHESIGHPLELDRILGDERNYAGTSFVSPDMFGTYQYGSELLTVSFNPLPGQLATFEFDHEGLKAEKELIIEKGILMRPLGGSLSRFRANLPGVACSRSSEWNRPPIDRMANLNVEPGSSTREELISSVERGIYVKSNRSWSIDDSRNKFQFGCELGRLINNGELGPLVKNPNYRGISGNFWRSLKGVGNMDTFEIHGTFFCGKGEPNQAMFVGHASPLCLFGDVDVFGGE